MKITKKNKNRALLVLTVLMYVYGCWVRPLTDAGNLLNLWYMKIAVSHIALFIGLLIAFTTWFFIAFIFSLFSVSEER